MDKETWEVYCTRAHNNWNPTWWVCGMYERLCVYFCMCGSTAWVLPTERIKLLKDWQFGTTDRKHEKSSSWHCAPFLLKKVIEKQPVFSQPTLVLVTKHWIHCAMVAMVMRTIYLGVKRALMQWAGCRDEVLGPELILFKMQNFDHCFIYSPEDSYNVC